MRNKTTICAVAVIVLVTRMLSQGATLNVRPPGSIMPLGGGVYTSIQAAIDDATPGDTIVVHTGTYKEQLVIWKALTLQGVGRETTIIDGNNGTGGNVTVVSITAPGDVLFSDFTVKNAPITNAGDLRFGILTNSSVAGVTYTISNNKVMGTNNTDAEQDYGIYGQNGGKENLVITNNIVTQTGANNIVVETHQGTTDISYNTLDVGCYGTDAIFVMTLSGVNVSSLQNVSHNNIDMSTGTARATGVTFATGVTTGVGGQFTNVRITDNTIFNLKSDRRGIGFWNNASGDGSAGNIVAPLVSGNTITGAAGDVTASMGMDTIGLVTDANMTNNTINGLDYSFKERTWNGHVAAGTKLNLNCFTNNTNGVLTDRTSGILDAINNSWGDASGPYHPVTNPTGLGDKVSDNVSYYPWYPNCSFTTPIYKPVHNVTLGAYYDQIQPAVNAARDGDFITAAAGIYSENITISKGVNLSSESGAGSTTIAGSGGITATITADNVTVNGFTITNPSGKGAVYGQDHSNITLTNNIVTDVGSSDTSTSGTNYGIAIVSSASAVGGVTITNNQINQIRGGNKRSVDAIAIGWSTGTQPITGVLIQNNVISDVTSDTSEYAAGGRGAYGVIINHGTGGGQTIGAQILDNTITNLEGLWAHAIGLEGDTPNALVSRNNISNLVDHKTPSDAVAVMVEANPSAGNIQLSCNLFSNLAVGVANVTTYGPVDAKNNWWGSATGPSGAGGGSGAAVTPNVDFFPWLLSSSDCGSTTQIAADFVVDDDWAGLPDWSTVTVDSINYYIGLNAFDTIQEAVGAASDGNNIRVLAGTYTEAVVINKSLNIRGATYSLNKNGYPVPADYAWDDSVESIINHPNPTAAYNAIVDIYDVNDVTFEGFVVQELHAVGNLNSSLVRVYAYSHEISNIKVRNNVIGANTNVTSQNGAQGRMGLYIVNHPYSNKGVTNSEFSGNKIFDCKGNGDNIFIWSSYFAYGAPSAASMRGTVINGNEIYGSHRSGIESAGGFADLMILNNKIYANSGLPSDDPNNLKYGNGILLIRGSSDKTSGPTSAYGPENVTIQGNEIYDNQKNGIYTDPIVKGLTIAGNDVHNNGWDAVRIDLEGTYWNPTFEPAPGPWSCYNGCSDVEVVANNLFNNGWDECGIVVVGTPTNGFVVEAEYNWWGNMKGPEDTAGTMETDGKTCYDVSVILNADGLGNGVSENVKYCPWLMAPIAASDSPCPVGDLDGDCDVDFLDFAVMAGNWLVGVGTGG